MRCSKPFIIFVPYTGPTPARPCLCCTVEPRTGHSRCGLTRTEQSNRITSLDLLAVLFLCIINIHLPGNTHFPEQSIILSNVASENCLRITSAWPTALIQPSLQTQTVSSERVSLKCPTTELLERRGQDLRQDRRCPCGGGLLIAQMRSKHRGNAVPFKLFAITLVLCSDPSVHDASVPFRSSSRQVRLFPAVARRQAARPQRVSMAGHPSPGSAHTATAAPDRAPRPGSHRDRPP